jgi:cytidyltransferase-like protein
MRVGLLGGSFNPAHEGHAHVAQTALARLGLDRVIWLVSPQNPLKSGRGTADLASRMEGARRWATGPGMRVGLYGGSFNPPHAGHAHVAQTALARLGLDRVIWLVSPQNPLKRKQPADLAARLAAAREMARGPSMIVSDLETRVGSRDTIDVIRLL